MLLLSDAEAETYQPTATALELLTLQEDDVLDLVGAFNAGLMRYAIEVNQGWFASHGVAVGMTATFTLPSGLTIEPDP